MNLALRDKARATLPASPAVARTIFGTILATLLAACGGGSSSPANSPETTVIIVAGAASISPACAADHAEPAAETFALIQSIRANPIEGEFIGAGGANAIDVEERKVVTVAVAAMTDALQRGLVGGPGTAGGTLHVAGSWLSNDANGYFSVTGTLGGKTVAVLVPVA